jgi:XTP/dITP diphosphohydrolase
MTTFVLATANPHKTGEMRAVLASLNIEVLPRPAHVPDVEENDVTLEGNALLKARALVSATGQPAVADDTGLFVDALNGEPGVFSARYAGEPANDDANVTKLLGALSGVAAGERSARFRTVIAVAYPDGSSLCVEGVLEGCIAFARRGEGGFGYDPVFEPTDGAGRTLAEYSAEEKNLSSHRARALHALADALTD